jgi:hypothetical protein
LLEKSAFVMEVEEEREEVKYVWKIHCIGVTEQGLLCQVHKPSKFITLRWCTLSSNLCSPFFTHTLELVPHTPNTYCVTQWLEIESRLDQRSNARKEVADILLNTLFLFLETRPLWSEKCNHFPWYMASMPLTVSYACPFDPETLFNWEDTPKAFWTQFRRVNAERLTETKKALNLPHPFTPNDLFRVLERNITLKHITPYLYHRMMEMDDLFTVVTHNATLELDICKMTTITLQDLATLHRNLRKMARNCNTQKQQHYTNLSQLIRTTLQGRLPQLLEYHFPLTVSDVTIKRQCLLSRLIVPVLMETLETRARDSYDSCFHVSYETLRWYYCTMMNLSCEKIDAQRSLPWEWCAPTSCSTISHFDHTHLGDVIVCMQTMPRVVRWHCRLDKEPIKQLYSTLFVIQPHKEELKRERFLHEQLWCRSDWPRACTLLLPPYTLQWDIPQWRRQYEQLDEIDRSLYQTRFVLAQFSPDELCQSCDMSAVEQLLRTDFHATSVILPPVGTNWTRHRLTQHFLTRVPDLTVEQLCEKVFLELNDIALRDTIVVLDAHLYSTTQMQTLFNWLEDKRGHYTHCVILGAYDTHPLHCMGHSFVDLALWQERVSVKQSAFDHTLHCTQFKSLIQCAAPYTHVIRTLAQLSTLLEELMGGVANSTMLNLIELVKPAIEKKKNKRSKFYNSVSNYDCLSNEFQEAHQIFFRSTALSELFIYTSGNSPQHRQMFVIEHSFMAKMSRNELNHLFTEQQCLIVLDTSGTRRTDVSWLCGQVEHKRFPNFRYTLPSLSVTETVESMQIV